MSQIQATLVIDGNQKPIDGSNLVDTVLATTYDATISGATSISLNVATTSYEVLAMAQPILLRFAAGVSTSAFDAVIAANTSKVFYRDPAVTTISVIEGVSGAIVAVIER